MSKTTRSTEGERERKARQRALSHPTSPTHYPVPPLADVPPHVTPTEKIIANAAYVGDGSNLVTPLPDVPISDNYFGTPLPTRSRGKTPEECGYPKGQVEVHKGQQGQNLWRLRGHYDLPNDILCHNASHELKRKPLYTLDELKAMFPDSRYLCGAA